MARARYGARARRAWRAHKCLSRVRAGPPLAAMGHKSPLFLQVPSERGARLPCAACVRQLTWWRFVAVGTLGALVVAACTGGALGYLAPPSALLATRAPTGGSWACELAGVRLVAIADPSVLRASRSAKHDRAMRAKRRPVAAAAVGRR